MGKIKNIVFDFGGILLDLDQEATYKAFSDLMGEDLTKINTNERVSNALIDYEKGLITDEAFIWKFQHLKGGHVDPIGIIKAWNAMLLGIRPEILSFLKDIKNQYRCVLLSNTNAIHIRYAVYNILEKIHGERNWKQYFHSIYYSHELNMRKPDHEIYNYVLEAENFIGNETLFIDDTRENVTAALQCGWHAIQHDPNEKIEDKIQEYIADCESI